jgi:hypothetical protein
MSTATHIRPVPKGVTAGSALAQVAARQDDIARALGARIDQLGRPVTPPATFEGIGSLPELIERGMKDPELLPRAFAWMRRTVADQITSQNPGLMVPAYLAETFGVMAAARPAVEAFGPRDAGEVGMALEFPFRSSSNVVAGVQAAQKTQVTSARVDIDMGTAELQVFAAGSDVSMQLWRRSSPSYKELYSRELVSAIALATEQAWCAALVAGSTVATYGWDADASGENLVDALYHASVEVEAATRAPASFGLASSDVFQELPRLERVVAPGSRGAPGRVTVAGFGDIIHTPALAAGTVIVSNPLAGGFAEAGPYSHENLDIAHFGVDLAMWSVGAPAIGIPAGIVRLYGPGASGS